MGSPLKKKSKLFPANTVTKTIWISTSKPAQSRMERMQRNMSGFRAHTWPVPRHIPTVTGSVFWPGLACPGHYLSLLKYCLSQGSLATTWACWSTACPRAPWPWPWPPPWAPCHCQSQSSPGLRHTPPLWRPGGLAEYHNLITNITVYRKHF